MFKYTARTWFVGGLIAGLLAAYFLIRVLGFSLISAQELENQQALVLDLQKENRELTDDLFKTHVISESGLDGADLPYDESADGRRQIVAAREEALLANKFLMVTFGANWCMDCRTLHRSLKSEDVEAYTSKLFRFVNVDVGKFNKNRDIAAELGVSLSRGIPVAIFFDPDGNVIGTTNDGQLEPARRYSSKQILRFIRDIAERSQITIPDAVQSSRASAELRLEN